MGFRCGIIGLPNVGKSTIFNAVTAAGAAVANYPFCTIEPNVGVVPVPDDRLLAIAALTKHEKVTPTVMEFLDIAGLVKGASKGEGLGNTFLGHIRDVDAVVHIVRCFDDPDVAHIHGAVDPRSDIEVVTAELILADLETCEKRINKARRQAKVGDKEAAKDVAYYGRFVESLGKGVPARQIPRDEKEIARRNELNLLTDKKVLYVANASDAELKTGNGYISQVEDLACDEGAEVITICGDMEAEIATLPEEERKEFMDDLGLAESGLSKLIKAGYKLLDLITFYTVAGPELRAWTVPAGTHAQKAAGKIHTDMERGFIRAEILRYDDFTSAGSVAAAKEKGLVKIEGRENVIHDGDIVYFRFNV